MKFDSNPIEEHCEVPLADDGRWEELVAHWQQREAPKTNNEVTQRSYVVSVALRREEYGAGRLEEILGLVRAQGDTIVGYEVCRIRAPDARALFRLGAAQALAERASEHGADVLIVDATLSPSQTRNLEDATGLSVRDREAVILNVFQRSVKTRKAKILVELAHLDYLRPRIRGLGLEMDQQAGGVTGSRGPGETASELLARQLDGRVAILRRAFKKVVSEGVQQRKRRDQCHRIALVGYTNAGKTSLMNRLTDAGLSAANRPFETLDTTSRCLTRHGGDVLISDTVGFIRNLPERLFASFESTLADICEASLVAMVVDVSDMERELHLDATELMLEKLGAVEIPRFYVFTKIDKLVSPLADTVLQGLSQGHPYIALSTHDLSAVGRLKEALLQNARPEATRHEVVVPYEATEAMALIYAKCRVLKTTATEQGMRFEIEAAVRRVKAIHKAIESWQR